VTPAAGSFPGSLTVNVTSIPVPPGTYFASITVDDGVATTVIPVKIVVKAASVNFVSPYVGTAGIGGDVVIRGFGFTGSTGVKFGSTPATSRTVVSDTEIHASYPGLPAGSHAVTVDSLSSNAQLFVTDPPGFAYKAIGRVGPRNDSSVNDLIYDAERKSIYLVGTNSAWTFERYHFNGVTWDPADAFAVGGVGDASRIALAPNGSEILQTTATQLVRINPVTLSTSFIDASSLGGTLSDIAFLNDGSVIGTLLFSAPGNISLYRTDLQSPLQFNSLSTQPDMGRRILSESGDGQKVVLPSSDVSSSFPISVFEATDGTLSQSSVNTRATTQASQDRTGSTLILTSFALTASQVTTVYDSSLNARGTLPSDLTGVVVSPNGAAAYAYFSSTSAIRKFDLSSPDGSGGFNEIGSVTAVADSPGTGLVRMVISPDGGTLFLAGTERVIIIPAP
jgi:hypothetical protein